MTWRRPTLPRLKTQYHWRGGFSRPSSEWDRVRAPRNDHQVIYEQEVVCLVVGSSVAALQLRRPPTVSLPSPTTLARERLRLTGEGSEQRVNGFLVRFGCLRTGWGFVIPAGGCLLRYLYLYEWIKPIERLVPVSFTCYHASTPGLSTWWSTTVLSETWF